MQSISAFLKKIKDNKVLLICLLIRYRNPSCHLKWNAKTQRREEQKDGKNSNTENLSFLSSYRLLFSAFLRLCVKFLKR